MQVEIYECDVDRFAEGIRLRGWKMSESKAERARKEKNKDLVERMRRGESLSQFDKEESWYPKRPKIKKDKKELDRLYGEDEKGKDADSKADV